MCFEKNTFLTSSFSINQYIDRRTLKLKIIYSLITSKNERMTQDQNKKKHKYKQTLMFLFKMPNEQRIDNHKNAKRVLLILV